MDMTTMPGWAQTALAITTVVIVALTMLANFLDWAVPRLRALGPKGEEDRALTAVEKFAKGLTTVLSLVHRLVPRLTIVEPVPTLIAPSTTVVSAASIAAAPVATTAASDLGIEASQAALGIEASQAAHDKPADVVSPHGPFAD